MTKEATTKQKPNFDYIKATQTLNYFASLAGGTINKMKALKLLFLADRYHLRKYGRLIAKNTYVAVAHGPVASGARDIIEQSNYIGESEKNYALQYIIAKQPHDMSSKKSPDKSVFSDSDIEALNFAWNNFGTLDQFELAFLTHFYPEWSKYEDVLKCNPSTTVKMDLNDFFDDPATNIEKCYELTDEDKKLGREHLAETNYIDSLWR